VSTLPATVNIFYTILLMYYVKVANTMGLQKKKKKKKGRKERKKERRDSCC
jgi:hypothetical protein